MHICTSFIHISGVLGTHELPEEDTLRTPSLFLMLCFHSVTMSLYEQITKKNRIIANAFT